MERQEAEKLPAPGEMDFFGRPVRVRGLSRGTYRLKLEGDLVIYSELSVFDENTGEWDTVQIRLPCSLFAAALREFRRRGCGKAGAENCEVEIKKEGEEVRIHLHGPEFHAACFSSHAPHRGISFFVRSVPREADELFTR